MSRNKLLQIVALVALLFALPAVSFAQGPVRFKAWAGVDSTGNLIPSFAFNSSGAANVITKVSTGAYRLRFTGVGEGGGVAHVTSANAATRCQVLGFQATAGSDTDLRVNCTDFSGNPADSAFNALFYRESRQTTSWYDAYFFNNLLVPPENHSGVAAFSWNSRGGVNTVTRATTGGYNVTLAGMANSPNSGTVLVTAQSATPAYCNSYGWIRSGADVIARVNCFSPAGNPQDSLFELSFMSDVAVGVNVAADQAPGAYAWADQAATAFFTSYTPDPGYSLNSSGGGFSANRVSLGSYNMFISLPAFTSTIAMVTPYASNASCGVTSQAASVAAAVCRNPAGAPVDTRYVVLYLTSGVLLAPTATLSGTSLTFAPQTIGTASAPQTVTLTNSGNTQLSFNSIFIIGANASDFSQAGTCPGLLGAPLAAGASCTYTFTFTPSAAGPRTASFRIANNAPDSPQTVTLTGTGQTPPPTVSPGTVTLSAAAGGGPVSQSVTLSIATASATPPTWSAFPNSPWLSVSPASGTMAATGPPAGGLTTWAATFNINANPAGNSAGAILFGSVALSIGGNPAAVPVAFTVTAPGTLTLSPTSLPFTWRAGDTTLPAPLNVAVTSQPPGIAISATASTTSGGNWLAVSSAATTPGTLSVSVVGAVLTTLAPGTYQGSVSVASPGAPTVTLAVTLTVTSGNGALTFSPPSVSFGWRAGTPLPASVNAAITSQPSGLALTVTSSTSSGGNWLTASGATTTPGTVTVSLVSGVVTALTPGTYSGSVNVASPGAAALALPVTLTVTATSAPTIIQSGVVPVFGTSTTIQPGSWISIFGTNLAPSTLVWNLDFPTSLNGVSVTINGKNGYLWFVSPTQINLQAPDDTQTGPVPVVVTTPTGTATSTVTLAPISPSLSLLDATHVAALTVYPNGTYTIVGPVGAFPYATTPAPAGSTLVLYGVGFGPTTAPVAAGKQPDSQVQTTNQVTVTVGGTPAPVLFSGLVAAGLYQINVTVPQGLPAGDQPVVATVAGLSTRAGTVVTIQ